MKNIVATVIVICLLSGCGKDGGKPNPQPDMIRYDFIDRPFFESWPDKGSEIHVKLDIRSEFTDDAYLVVYTWDKQYRPCTRYKIYDLAISDQTFKDSTVYHPVIYESFRDSLKIEGFHIRANLEANLDYPIYFKEIRVKKGKNRHDFKIVFPRKLVEIPSHIDISLGIGIFNNEIKSKFEENFPGNYILSEREKDAQNLYFEAFPDSSKTSFVFSNFLMRNISFVPDEPCTFSSDDLRDKIRGKHYFYAHWISLNDYGGVPSMKCEECIIYR